MSCTNTETPARQSMQPELIEALLCLVNEERAKSRIPPLYLNDRLRNAALEHAAQAAALKWWSGDHQAWHINPVTGSTPESRILASGFAHRAVLSAHGEVCHAGVTKESKGEFALTPRHALDNWLGFPEERATLLNPAFKSAGIAILPESAQWSSGKETDYNPSHAIYVMTFGTAYPVITPVRSPFELPPIDVADYSWLGSPKLVPVCPYPVGGFPFGVVGIPVSQPFFERPR